MKRYLFIIMLLSLIFISGCDLQKGKDTANAEFTSTSLQNERSDEQKSNTKKNINDNTDDNANDSAEEKDNKNPSEMTSIPINDKTSIIMYYQDKDGYIIPVTRKVVKQEGIAKAAISALVDSSLIREELNYFGLYPVLPIQTKVLGMTIKEGIAFIDFNSKVLNYNSETEERNIITSIVYTLTEFKTVEGVKILVNGYTLSELEFGTEISDVLSRDNIMINHTDVNVENGKKLDGYFFKQDNIGKNLILPISFKDEGRDEDEKPKSIVGFISTANKDERLLTLIPAGTTVIDSKIEGNRLSLNLSSEIVSYGGGNLLEDGIIRQLLYSMGQIKGIEKVRILIEGGTKEMPEGSDLTKDIYIPNEINNIIDN